MNPIQKMLEENDVTAYKLARQVNLVPKTVYEAAEREPLDIDQMTYGVLWRIAQGLGVSVEELRPEYVADLVSPKMPGAIPPEVLEALAVLTDHLNEYGFKQLILSDSGGAAFQITDMYEDALRKRLKPCGG